MITTLDQLRKRSADWAKAIPPDLRREVDLSLMREDAVELGRVLTELNFPSSYTECAVFLDLADTSLAGLLLTPSHTLGLPLGEALLASNSPSAPWNRQFADQGFLVVSAEEANAVCVAAANHPQAGVVFRFDHSSSEPSEPRAIANDFRHFLLLAGNLAELTYSERPDLQALIAAFDAACENLGCTEDQMRFWAAYGHGRLAALAQRNGRRGMR